MNGPALAALRDDPIDWRYKGFPAAEGVTPGTIASRGWNLLAGDLPLPALVLRETALEHNLALMRRYCERYGVSLAPHGKTTMSPELFERQLGAGAWAITAATASQVRVYRHFGVERIVLANELVDPVSIAWLAAELARDPGFELFSLVDSPRSVRALSDALLGEIGRPWGVLVELGLSGGRTGCRTVEDALRVAELVAAEPSLELVGVEAFEGIIHGEDMAGTLARVDGFLDTLWELASTVAGSGALDGRDEMLLTVGGSAYFDRIASRGIPELGLPVRVVLRSGCYVTHDHGLYDELSALGARGRGEQLQPALEAWGSVVSRPEPELALLGLGKRDVPYDVGLPVPLLAAAAGALRDIRATATVSELNDQHAYLHLPTSDPLAVGDLVGCGISHPCTAFDKWRLIAVVDDEYTVIDAVHTFF